MDVSVLVPFGGTDPHRLAALDWLTARLPVEWEVVVGRHDGPWCKASAVNDALRRSTGDLLIVHDADVWCDQTANLVEQVETWGMPHHLVHRLNEPATTAVLAGTQPHSKLGHAEKPYTGFWGGGIVALRRDVYEAAPLDPRFTGWGQEDESWSFALECLYPETAVRLDGDLFHLWHPDPDRQTRRIGNHEGRMLGRRYWHARNDLDAMRSLLEEVTPCPTPHT